MATFAKINSSKVTRYNKIILIISGCCIIISSCKLDKPIAPTAADAGIETVLGITVVGKNINNNYLTAEWKTIRTADQYYDSSYVLISGVGIPGKFTSVTLDDKAKTFKYTGLPATAGAASGSYKLATTDNVLFMTIGTNPFFAKSKSQLRITSLTSTSMTWVAMDTTLANYNGLRARHAYEILFIKKIAL